MDIALQQEDLYQIGLIAFFSVLVIGVFMGSGKNRSLIVYRDYDDLGLTFLMPNSFIIITLLFSNAGEYRGYGILLGAAVALLLFIKLVIDSYVDNGRSIWKTALAIFVKVPLCWLWMLNLLCLLNPDGNTARERRQNRAQALVFLALITPIIGLLVADKSGSFFSPRAMLRNRRGVSSVRKHL